MKKTPIDIKFTNRIGKKTTDATVPLITTDTDCLLASSFIALITKRRDN
jgi:hypothetical protein